MEIAYHKNLKPKNKNWERKQYILYMCVLGTTIFGNGVLWASGVSRRYNVGKQPVKTLWFVSRMPSKTHSIINRFEFPWICVINRLLNYHVSCLTQLSTRHNCAVFVAFSITTPLLCKYALLTLFFVQKENIKTKFPGTQYLEIHNPPPPNKQTRTQIFIDFF